MGNLVCGHAFRSLLLCALFSADFLPSGAQSLDDNWSDRFDLPGVEGTVSGCALATDGNLYIRGDLRGATGLPARQNMLHWDGRRWNSLGVSDDTIIVEGLTLRIERDRPILIAGGLLHAVADNFMPLSNPNLHGDHVIRRANGEWEIVGNAFHGTIRDLVSHEGALYAAGSFDIVGSDAIRRLARWDGSRWSEVAGGVDGSISAMAVDANGALYASGDLTRVGNLDGSLTCARWDGIRWTAIESGDVESNIEEMIASGMTMYARARERVYRLDGTRWIRFDEQLDSIYQISRFLGVDSIGGVHIGARRRSPVNSPFVLLRLSGNTWTELPHRFDTYPNALAFGRSGSFAAAGGFTIVNDSLIAPRVAMWDGSAWQALVAEGRYDGLVGDISAIEHGSDGWLYVGGSELRAPHLAGTHGILRWSEGTGWEEVGGGVNGTVAEILRDTNGHIYVGGCFDRAGNVDARNLARWNGFGWHPVGDGPDLCLSDFTFGRNRIYAVSGRTLLRWAGARWEHLAEVTGGGLYTVAASDDGSVYVGGQFGWAGGLEVNNVAQWKEGRWHSLDGGMRMRDPVYPDFSIPRLAVHVLETDGPYLYAGGMFDSAGSGLAYNIARWNGSGWQGLDSGLVGLYPGALYNLPSGERAEVRSIRVAGGRVYATGRFYGAGTWEFFRGITSVRYMSTGGGMAWWDERTGLWNSVGLRFPVTEVNDFALDGDRLFIGGPFWKVTPEARSFGVARTIVGPERIDRPIVSEALDFGQVPVGRSAGRDLIITNPATSTRTMSGTVTLEGGPFGPATEIEFRVATGYETRIPLSFSPAIVGYASGTATIHHNSTADPTPVVVRLNGLGVPLDVAYDVAPAALNFNERLTGSGTDSIMIAVRNSSASNSSLTVRAEGFLAAPFTLVSEYHYRPEYALRPVTIPPGDSTRYYVRLSKSNPGEFLQTLVLHHDGVPGGTVEIPVRATIVPRFAALRISPSSVNVGKIAIGQSMNDTIRLMSDPRSNTDLYYLPLEDSIPPFLVPRHGGNRLDPGESHIAIFTFAPETTGAFHDTLRIAQRVDGWFDTLSIPITGHAVASSPELLVSRYLVVFPTTEVDTSQTSGLFLSNHPDATEALTVTIGDLGIPFSIQHGTYTVMPSDTLYISIRFAPTQPITYRDSLFITHDAPNVPSPLKILVSGSAFATTSVHGSPHSGEEVLLTAEPNPTSGRTRIRFNVPRAGVTSLSIHSLDGREVAKLIDQRFEAGEHSIEWDAAGVESGVYLCRMKIGDAVVVGRIVVSR